MKTPVNGKTLRQHWMYCWWKYCLVIALGLGIVSLYYSVTTYHPPEDKKIEMMINSYLYTDKSILQAYFDTVRENDFPDMEEVTVQLIIPDETYGEMTLSTRIAAHEGDMYILPKESYYTLASSGAFAPLENEKDLLSLFADVDESAFRTSWRKNDETKESHLYAIPLRLLPGLSVYMPNIKDYYLAVMIYNGNEENVLRFMKIFCRDMMEEPIPVEVTATP